MTTAEFVVEAAGLDLDEVTRAVGVWPTLAARQVQVPGAAGGLVDRWVFALPDPSDRFGEPPVDAGDCLFALGEALRGRAYRQCH
jgi:hypothetical protein